MLRQKVKGEDEPAIASKIFLQSLQYIASVPSLAVVKQSIEINNLFCLEGVFLHHLVCNPTRLNQHQVQII